MERARKIVKMHKEGLSQAQIAIIADVDHRTVSAVLDLPARLFRSVA